MRLTSAARRALRLSVRKPSDPIFDDQGAPDRAQGPLDVADVGTMVGIQELANRGFTDVEALGQLSTVIDEVSNRLQFGRGQRR